MDKRELVALIKSAFNDVPYPGDDHIAAPNPRGDEYLDLNLEEIVGVDRYEIPLLKLWPESLYFMSPEAVHYYIPAHMIGAIEELELDEWLYPTNYMEVLRQLLRPSTWAHPFPGGNYFETNLRRFSQSQRMAVAEFFDYQGEAELRDCWLRLAQETC